MLLQEEEKKHSLSRMSIISRVRGIYAGAAQSSDVRGCS